jgi:hypothetical protein
MAAGTSGGVTWVAWAGCGSETVKPTPRAVEHETSRLRHVIRFSATFQFLMPFSFRALCVVAETPLRRSSGRAPRFEVGAVVPRRQIGNTEGTVRHVVDWMIIAMLPAA